MAHRANTSRAARVVRHERIRKKVGGTQARPRIAVFRSLNHIYAQLIDDDSGRTLAQASSLEAELTPQGGAKTKKQEVAVRVGALLAQRATTAGITQAVFDRGGYQYHGRVRALADAVRKGGLVF